MQKHIKNSLFIYINSCIILWGICFAILHPSTFIINFIVIFSAPSHDLLPRIAALTIFAEADSIVFGGSRKIEYFFSKLVIQAGIMVRAISVGSFMELLNILVYFSFFYRWYVWDLFAHVDNVKVCRGAFALRRRIRCYDEWVVAFWIWKCAHGRFKFPSHEGWVSSPESVPPAALPLSPVMIVLAVWFCSEVALHHGEDSAISSSPALVRGWLPTPYPLFPPPVPSALFIASSLLHTFLKLAPKVLHVLFPVPSCMIFALFKSYFPLYSIINIKVTF